MDVITTDIDHADFPDVIFITDRGYMSTKGCEPGYKSRKAGRKRGRPRKNPEANIVVTK